MSQSGTLLTEELATRLARMDDVGVFRDDVILAILRVMERGLAKLAANLAWHVLQRVMAGKIVGVAEAEAANITDEFAFALRARVDNVSVVTQLVFVLELLLAIAVTE